MSISRSVRLLTTGLLVALLGFFGASISAHSSVHTEAGDTTWSIANGGTESGAPLTAPETTVAVTGAGGGWVAPKALLDTTW